MSWLNMNTRFSISRQGKQKKGSNCRFAQKFPTSCRHNTRSHWPSAICKARSSLGVFKSFYMTASRIMSWNCLPRTRGRRKRQKKRRFHWERTIETAFRAYERSGRGREIYKLYKPIRLDRPIGYVLPVQKIFLRTGWRQESF